MVCYLSLSWLVANIDFISEITCSTVFPNTVLFLGSRNNNPEPVCNFFHHTQTNLCQLWIIDLVLQILLIFQCQKLILPFFFPSFFDNIVLLDGNLTCWLVSSIFPLALVLSYISLYVSHTYLIIVCSTWMFITSYACAWIIFCIFCFLHVCSISSCFLSVSKLYKIKLTLSHYDLCANAQPKSRKIFTSG